ncbi:hypothetical protein [Treponema sp. R6D11]
MNNRKKTWLIVLLTFIFIAAIVWFVAMANKDKDLPRATTIPPVASPMVSPDTSPVVSPLTSPLPSPLVSPDTTTP